MTIPISYEQIEQAILKTLKRQETLTNEYASAGDELAEAERGYRYEYAVARVTYRQTHFGERPMNQDMVDDAAEIATHEERSRLENARANHDINKQALYSVRERLNALRSLMASHRGATGDDR